MYGQQKEQRRANRAKRLRKTTVAQDGNFRHKELSQCLYIYRYKISTQKKKRRNKQYTAVLPGDGDTLGIKSQQETRIARRCGYSICHMHNQLCS